MSSETSDAELIAIANRGDAAAREALARRHAGPLLGLARALTPNEADAEDVVQETLMAAFETLDRFRGDASFRTWLRSILVRQVARGYRKSYRRPQLLGPGSGEGDAVAEQGWPEAAISRPSDEATFRMDFSHALAALPDEQRLVVCLREIDGMSYQEIADTLDIALGTVESRLHRARQALRALMKDYMTE